MEDAMPVEEPLAESADEWFAHHAAKVLRNPRRWLEQAERLKHVADAVYRMELQDAERLLTQVARVEEAMGRGEEPAMPSWEGRRLGSVHLMLCGYALENLMKGLLVADDPSLILEVPSARNAVLANRLRRHSLEEHLRDQGEGLGDEGWQAVREAEHAVLWTGRYPGPNRPIDTQIEDRSHGGHRAPGHFYTGWAYALDGLYERLHERLSERTRLWEEERQAAHERGEAAERARRGEVEAELHRTHAPVLSGPVVYWRSAEPLPVGNTGTHAVRCDDCGLAMSLDLEQDAVQCPCDHLWVGRRYYHGESETWVLHVFHYPRDA
jgi:hypothetical protein